MKRFANIKNQNENKRTSEICTISNRSNSHPQLDDDPNPFDNLNIDVNINIKCPISSNHPSFIIHHPSSIMVLYTLYIKATLEGVSAIRCFEDVATSQQEGHEADTEKDGNDHDDNRRRLLCLTVKHPLDPSEIREKIVVDFSQLEESTTALSLEEKKKHHPKQKQKHNNNASSKHHDKPSHFHLTWSDGSKGTIRVVQVLASTKTASSIGSTNTSDSNSTTTTIQDDTWFPILTLECDHVEPIYFHPLGSEFAVQNATTGKWYHHVDLSGGSSNSSGDDDNNNNNGGGDWSAYDMASGTTAVTNLQSKFE